MSCPCPSNSKIISGHSNPARSSRFFKVMTPGFLSKISMPVTFCDLLDSEKQRLDIVVLSTEKGSWEVKVGDRDERGRSWLEKGWGEFAKRHDVRVGDFLVFEHQGDGRFRVFVFSPSGCEKSMDEVEWQMKQSTTVLRKGGCENKLEAVVQDTTSFGVPNNPHFIATIVPSNCSCKNPYMNIPTTFSDRNPIVDSTRRMVLRDPLGRLWPVKLQKRIKRRYHFTAGWNEFYVANKLKTGDVCVFESDPKNALVSRETIFDVHITPR